MIILIVYLFYNFHQLNTEKQKNRVGAAYTHLAVEKAGLSVLVFLVLQFTRIIALSFVITFGEMMLVQLLFMNFCSFLLLIFVGMYRPFATK